MPTAPWKSVFHLFDGRDPRPDELRALHDRVRKAELEYADQVAKFEQLKAQKWYSSNEEKLVDKGTVMRRSSGLPLQRRRYVGHVQARGRTRPWPSVG